MLSDGELVERLGACLEHAARPSISAARRAQRRPGVVDRGDRLAIPASTRSSADAEPRLVGRDPVVEVARGDRAADEARRHDRRDHHPDRRRRPACPSPAAAGPRPASPSPMVRGPASRRTLGAAAGGARVERIGFVGLGTMGAAMAANLRRAGFPVTAWNRTPGRAGDLVALGRHARPRRRPRSPAASRRRRRAASPTRRTSRPSCSGRRRRERARARARSSSTAPRSRPSATAGSPRGSRSRASASSTRRSPAAPRARRRRRSRSSSAASRRRRARPAGPRGDGQDHHPLRARRLRPGRQGRQPGRARRHLPRRRRGDGARDQGRPRPAAVPTALGGGAAAQLGPREPQRAHDRQRLPARVPDRRSTSRTSPSRWSWPARSARRCPVAALARAARGGPRRPRPRRRGHVEPGARDPRAVRPRG